ncbi:rod shape-determining protein MreC [Lactobacillus sp.]|uniref:rod shape-determining protein MreC n=1 Tax=Lactobacillus sp. TaxID=1591 RepID=UPI0019A3DB01|nr:rod shape-determining protein MreC [Lactobacillus sp.]MBD5430044.1 rod shape-determining protein MreC [Lactobacillus sp.]
MKNFFKNKKILATFIIIIVILSMLTVSVNLRNRRSAPTFVQKLGNDTMAIVSRVVKWPVSLVTGSVDSVQNLVNAQNENDHLKKQIDDLAQTKARNSALESENTQLKQALKLKSTLSDYDIVNGSVISRSPDSWSDLLVINQGSQSGIKKNMAVMSGSGVIGRIIEVNRTSSKVELITSTDKSANRFAVEATAADGKKVHGIISVTSDNKLAFTQVVDGRKLKKGTRVYTSGMGGRSPKGLLVGTVKKTTRDSYGLSDVIEIKPAGNINDPSVVSVIERKVAE